jgi:RimJ/RimL family protein N-acetyltransferase
MELPPEPPDTVPAGEAVLVRARLSHLDELDAVITSALPHLIPFMPWASVHTRDSAEDYLTRAQTGWNSGQTYNYLITADGGRIVGATGLMRRIGPLGFEIGYWLHQDWTGRGIVTHASAALTRTAFTVFPETERVEIHHDEANKASGAVPDRLGFTVAGHLRKAEGEAVPDALPPAPAATGVSVVHRIDRAAAEAAPWWSEA